MSPERALGKSIDNNVEKIQGNDNIFDYFVKEAEIFGFKIFGDDIKNCWVGGDAENTYHNFGGSSNARLANRVMALALHSMQTCLSIAMRSKLSK